jgi:hypothetical protein
MIFIFIFLKINEENIVIRKKSSLVLWCRLEISHCQLAEPLPLETHAVRYGIQGLGLDVLQVCGTTNGSQQRKRKTAY